MTDQGNFFFFCLKTILYFSIYFHYYYIIAPLGKVTFSRRYLPANQLPKWCYSTKKLTKLIVQDKGYIEEQEGMLQVDFANR